MSPIVKVLLTSLIAINLAVAQGTGGTANYSREDRPVVYAVGQRLSSFLYRMSQLAEWVAGGSLNLNQISAVSAEFEAWKLEIGNVASNNHPLLSAQSLSYISQHFSVIGLGLGSTTLLGSTIPQAQLNARDALDLVNYAIAILEVGVANDAAHVTINGSINTGGCAGGFTQSDRPVVKQILLKTTGKLAEAYKALFPALSPMSLLQRTAVNGEFTFLKEEIELLGENPPAGISSQTQNFLQTVVDPIYLGINSAVITAPTVEGAQQQAASARVALAQAYDLLVACSQ